MDILNLRDEVVLEVENLEMSAVDVKMFNTN